MSNQKTVSAKPPVQAFDVRTLVRFRVHGTKEQVESIYELFQQLIEEDTRAGLSARYSVQVGTSGPVGEGAQQWAMCFWVVPLLVNRIAAFMVELGLTREEA